MVIIPLLVIELKAIPNGNPRNDFYWRQKSSSLNVVQYNSTSRPIIILLQIYICLYRDILALINAESCDAYYKKKKKNLISKQYWVLRRLVKMSHAVQQVFSYLVN